LNKPVLILIASLNAIPVALLFLFFSDPAKSTICNIDVIVSYPSSSITLLSKQSRLFNVFLIFFLWVNYILIIQCDLDDFLFRLVSLVTLFRHPFSKFCIIVSLSHEITYFTPST